VLLLPDVEVVTVVFLFDVKMRSLFSFILELCRLLLLL